MPSKRGLRWRGEGCLSAPRGQSDAVWWQRPPRGSSAGRLRDQHRQDAIRLVPDQPIEELPAGNHHGNFRPESPSRLARERRGVAFGEWRGRVGNSVGRRSSGVARRSCDGAAAELRSALPTVLPEVPKKIQTAKNATKEQQDRCTTRAAPSKQSRTTHRPNIGQQCLALHLPSQKPLREQWQHITQRFHDGNAPPEKDDERPNSSAAINKKTTKKQGCKMFSRAINLW